MPTTTLTSRRFNQDVGSAKRAAKTGPVVITDRGRPSHVLMTFEDYRRLGAAGMSLAQSLAEEGPSDFDFEAPKLTIELDIPDLS